MTEKLKNKVALIVGGTGSIGSATAIAFARLGCKIIIAGRNKPAGEEVLKSIANAGSEGVFIQTDLTDLKSVDNLAQQALAEYGTIDIAFNNAGWEGVPAKTADIEEADWHKMLDIKLTGVWRCMKFELKQMVKQGSGAIVNMSGNWGLVGFPEYGAYCAAAHGIMGITKAAALEYVRDGIRVNAICPGAVDTPLLDRIFGGNQEIKKGYGEQLPMGRIATPEEIAEAVLWLCSDSASYVNGHGLELTGGS
ncbi:MAG: NAD(P)-dependent dehydrogenase (short-subunit alcohol dehydrogenase family) [Gammaproteobacteria bacterium]|jgi:NAD(P)-dependent dehydrogenase (short-subunit alcohol dehydrogenase family)